jgi:Ca2+/H+ antiporter
MKRWQNAAAIVAMFFAAGAVWPWAPLNRVVCAVLAFMLILVVLASRLQQHASSVTQSRASIKDMESRIQRIRAERDRRFQRK